MQSNFTNINEIKNSIGCSEIPKNKSIKEDLESIREPIKSKDWIYIFYNTFFSTGVETFKQKET
jgi:hypothetical protein